MGHIFFSIEMHRKVADGMPLLFYWHLKTSSPWHIQIITGICTSFLWYVIKVSYINVNHKLTVIKQVPITT